MVKPSVSAEKGNPSSLLRPNPGEKVEMDPNPIYGEGDHHGHGDKLSAGAILKGDAGHTMPSTPFEMKAALVNRELDKMGLGRYQKAIWLLCGFGYFVDLMWSQGLGLLATALYQEFGVPEGRQGVVFSAMSAGLTAGAFFWGLAVDVIGRKWAFNMTVLITCVFGSLVAASQNYATACAMFALCGFGLGGQIPIDATITLEFLPQNRRYLLSLLSMWQPIGVVVASAITFGTVPKYRCPTTEPPLPACFEVADGEPCCSPSSNYGWRVCCGVLGGITLLVFIVRFFVFNFYESPKYLIGRGKEEEAIDVLHKIARYNKMPPPELTMEHFNDIDTKMSVVTVASDEELLGRKLTVMETAKRVFRESFKRAAHLKGLFMTPIMAFTTIVLWIAYVGDFWSFNIAGSFLPIILQRRNLDRQISVTETYRQYIYIYLPGILGAIMAMFAVQLPVIGRKWSLVIGAALQGVSMACYTAVNTPAAAVGLNAFEYIMQTFFNAILYATTPEFFPAYVRGSACGLASTLGRLSGIVAPFAAQDLLAKGSNGVLWLAVGGIWLSMLVLIFLPIETRHRQSY